MKVGWKMKEIRKVLITLIGLVLILPIIVNITMFIPYSLTTNELTQKDWLGFWGGYIGGAIGGIGTIIAVLYTIKYYEIQNKKSYMSNKNSLILQKIDIIIEKIIERETIPSSLFKYDKEINNISSDLEKYNSLVSDLSAYFTDIAVGIFIRLFFINDENGEELPNNVSNYLKLPEEIREYAFIVGKLALHENCPELIKGHPKIGHIIEKEGGGSYGMWHRFLHNFEDDDYREQCLKELFSIVPKLLEDIRNIKLSLQ